MWPGAGFEVFGHLAAVQFLAQLFQSPYGLGFEAAVRQFLDPVGQAAFEITPVKGRGLAFEQLSPLVLELWRRGSFQRDEPR